MCREEVYLSCFAESVPARPHALARASSIGPTFSDTRSVFQIVT
jgi:hypothetical protein